MKKHISTVIFAILSSYSPSCVIAQVPHPGNEVGTGEVSADIFIFAVLFVLLLIIVSFTIYKYKKSL